MTKIKGQSSLIKMFLRDHSSLIEIKRLHVGSVQFDRDIKNLRGSVKLDRDQDIEGSLQFDKGKQFGLTMNKNLRGQSN